MSLASDVRSEREYHTEAKKRIWGYLGVQGLVICHLGGEAWSLPGLGLRVRVPRERSDTFNFENFAYEHRIGWFPFDSPVQLTRHIEKRINQ